VCRGVRPDRRRRKDYYDHTVREKDRLAEFRPEAREDY